MPLAGAGASFAQHPVDDKHHVERIDFAIAGAIGPGPVLKPEEVVDDCHYVERIGLAIAANITGWVDGRRLNNLIDAIARRVVVVLDGRAVVILGAGQTIEGVIGVGDIAGQSRESRQQERAKWEQAIPERYAVGLHGGGYPGLLVWILLIPLSSCAENPPTSMKRAGSGFEQ